jgi:hypothetical protein
MGPSILTVMVFADKAALLRRGARSLWCATAYADSSRTRLSMEAAGASNSKSQSVVATLRPHAPTIRRRRRAIDYAASGQDFLPGGLIDWPVAACDFLYSDIELFGLSDFGFFASLLLRIWPLAIGSSIRQPPSGAQTPILT